MTADDGSCLNLEGVGFGDSRESGKDDPTLRSACASLRMGHPAPERNGLSQVEEPADVREIFLELRAPIRRYLMSFGLQRAEAEDIAQESFLRLCERAPTGNVRGWIFRVAHNLAQDEHRRRKRRPTEELQSGENLPPFASPRVGHPEPSDGRPSPEQSLLEREQDARLKAALTRLPEQQRQCLHLRAEGLRYREMAEVLGVGTSTVAEWIQKGLKQLERELA